MGLSNGNCKHSFLTSPLFTVVTGNDLVGTEYNGLDGSWGRGRGLGRGRARGGYRGRGMEQDPSGFDEPHSEGPPQSRGAEVTQDISFSGI